MYIKTVCDNVLVIKGVTDYRRISRPYRIFCVHQLCRPGYGRVYGQIQNSSTIKYGWTCEKCRSNYISKFKDSSLCVPCPSHLISNDNGDRCVDPYRNDYISTEKKVVQIVITISIVGSCCQ